MTNISQDAAALLGERGGRSLSRIIGTGLSRTLGGAITPSAATDLAHAVMVTGLVAPKARGWILSGLALAYLIGR